MSRTQAWIVTIGVTLAAILFAWPHWIASHPSGHNLDVPLGRARLWSPLPPLKGFASMPVGIGRAWLLSYPLGILIVTAALRFMTGRKNRPLGRKRLLSFDAKK